MNGLCVEPEMEIRTGTSAESGRVSDRTADAVHTSCWIAIRARSSPARRTVTMAGVSATWTSPAAASQRAWTVVPPLPPNTRT